MRFEQLDELDKRVDAFRFVAHECPAKMPMRIWRVAATRTDGEKIARQFVVFSPFTSNFAS